MAETLPAIIKQSDMPELYAAARNALVQASTIDEVKDIRDKAVALKVYADQAKDSELIKMATQIRLRAERRAGEMLQEMAKQGMRAVRKNMKSQPATSRLIDLNISKTQSSRWQKLAVMSEPQFEKAVQEAVTHEPRRAKKRSSAEALDIVRCMNQRINAFREVLHIHVDALIVKADKDVRVQMAAVLAELATCVMFNMNKLDRNLRQ
jgi:5-carboxymethyl-2-hydroxymuconate isomerase